jgi:hypothetical protein
MPDRVEWDNAGEEFFNSAGESSVWRPEDPIELSVGKMADSPQLKRPWKVYAENQRNGLTRILYTGPHGELSSNWACCVFVALWEGAHVKDALPLSGRLWWIWWRRSRLPYEVAEGKWRMVERRLGGVKLG